MKIYDLRTFSKIFSFGKINGHFDYFEKAIDSANCVGIKVAKKGSKQTPPNRLENSVIIVCGDSGFGIMNTDECMRKMERLNAKAEKLKCVILFVRGNHDDPSFFTEEKINFPNVKTIPDYSVVLTEKHATLCIGGAVSFDKKWRLTRQEFVNKYKKDKFKTLFWEDEKVVFDKNILEGILNPENDFKIDSIVTHTYPRFKNVLKKDEEYSYWSKSDNELHDKLKEEDKTIKSIYSLISKSCEIKFWLSSHVNKYNAVKSDKVPCIQMSNDCALIDVDEAVTLITSNSESLKMKFTATFNKEYGNVPTLSEIVDRTQLYDGVAQIQPIEPIEDEMDDIEMDDDVEIPQEPRQDVGALFGDITAVRNMPEYGYDDIEFREIARPWDGVTHEVGNMHHLNQQPFPIDLGGIQLNYTNTLTNRL